MKKISLFSLVLLIVTAIDSIRNLPTSALFGSALIFFFIFAAIFFLIPISLVSAELSAGFPDKGGVYHWVDRAFGSKWAMIAIWLQWINTMVWYPTILSFIAGTAAYLIDPSLADHKGYLVGVILIVFWGLTLVNLRGIQVSAKINNSFGLVGTIFPLIFLIVLCLIWVLKGNSSQIEINRHTIFPALDNSTNWMSLIGVMAAFLGMELSGVHVNDIRNPQRNFPKAIFFAALFILLSMMFGSLAIAIVIPQDQINLVSGVMQVFTNYFDAFGIRPLIPVLTVLIVIGSIGSMTNWLIAPAKGLLHAAEFGFLPAFFTKKNRAGVAARILIAQGILVSLFCLVFFLFPSVNGFYWFLMALSTELYMIMYILIFFSALHLHYRHKERPPSFKIPGKHLGIWICCLFGILGCLATISVSFFPPTNVNIGSSTRYIAMICAGNIVTIAPVLLFYWYKKKKK